jgi:hypothetical protein
MLDVSLAQSVVISEILYQPPGGSDFAEAEFVELLNPGSTQTQLGGATFTAGITYTFPAGTVLAPGARIVVGRNLALLRSRYGTLPGLMSSAFSGALNNSGENLTLSSAAGAVLATVRFAASGDWPGRPAGNGGSVELVDPRGSQSDAANWRASSEYLGSPGTAGAGPMNRVVVNELLAHTDPPLEDAVELHNRTDSPIDVGGWYLSNSMEDPLRFRIPTGTVVPARGFRVVYEYQFNPANPPAGRTAFTFGAARGDDVVLLSADAVGNPLRWEDDQSFPASPNGVSFGRYPDGEGPFLLMSRTSLGTAISNTDPEFWIEFFRQGAGAANPQHALGPVVFERIRYSAAADGIEFVELRNVGDIEMPLYDPAYPTNTWGLEGGVTFRFPEGLILGPGGRIVVASTTNAAAVRSLLSLPASVPVVGPYSGQLSSEGERIQLVRPDTPQLPPREDAGFVPYYVVEQIDYSASSPWPVLGTPGSQLIRRRSVAEPGYLASNWEAAPVESVPPRVDLAVSGWNAGVLRLQATGPSGSTFRIQSVAISGTGAVTVLADSATGTFSAATGVVRPDGRFRVEVEVPAGSAGALFRALIP